MAAIIGISPDVETSKWQAENDFKNFRNWKTTEPFKDKKVAKDWEKKKSEELGVKTYQTKVDTKRVRVEWRGFYFEHDGRR